MRTLYLLTSEVSDAYVRELMDRLPSWYVADAQPIESTATPSQVLAEIMATVERLDGRVECGVVARLPQELHSTLLARTGTLIIDQKTIDTMARLQPLKRAYSPAIAIMGR